MDAFVYNATPARILFGRGMTAELGREVEKLHASHALVLTTREQKALGEEVAVQLGVVCEGVFFGAVMHTPTEVTEQALELVRSLGVDCLVAVGGGSAIGLGKALAARTGLPQVAVPTTYAGSEVTPILGETHNGVKRTRRGPEILPEVVIYDVERTLSLPVPLSAASGVNAMAHAAEALYARDANPVTSLMAEEGIRALARGIPVLLGSPEDIEAREQSLYGAWLCGSCLGGVGMALHHKLCHVLGGAFDLPHAHTHAIVLGHSLAYNEPVAEEAMKRVARALGGDGAASMQVHSLIKRMGLPLGLRDIGMPEPGLSLALELVLQESYWNPRPMDADALECLLRNAWEGVAPTGV